MVRDDTTEPGVGIIRLDDVRHVLLTECQWQPDRSSKGVGDPPYPADLYPGCPCYVCDSPTWERLPGGFPSARMSLCPTCGSKRCPGAEDHRKHAEAPDKP